MAHLVFHVNDMNCQHCEHKIRKVLEDSLRCQDVSIDLNEKTVSVQTQEGFETIKEALADIGYTAQLP